MAIIITAYPASLELTQGEHIVEGTINANDVQFVLPKGDSAWEGMTLVACFRSLLCERCVVLDFDTLSCKFPWEVNDTGSVGSPVSIGLYGAGDPEGTTVVRSTVWVDLPFRILPGVTDEVEPPTTEDWGVDPAREPTPSQYQQMLAAVSGVVQRMDTLREVEAAAAASAGSARASADGAAGSAQESSDSAGTAQRAAKDAQSAQAGAENAQARTEDLTKRASDILSDVISNANTVEQALADTNVFLKRISDLEENVADLMYEEIAFVSFSHNAGTRERGETVTGVTLSWATNKTPAALTLDGESIDPEKTSVLLDGLSIMYNSSKLSWTLIAVDERNAVASKSTSISFLNGVYYGAAYDPGTINSDFILNLTKTLSSTRARTVTVNAGEGKHIWYALPARLGKCTFTVGGFEGGFDLVVTLDFTNSKGYTEPYHVYKSSQTGLGNTKVVVA